MTRSFAVLRGLALLALLCTGATAHAQDNPWFPSNIDASQDPEVEPNGTLTTATPLTLRDDAAVVVGNVLTNGDVDYYAFVARAGDRVYAMYTMEPAEVGSGLLFELRASNGTTVIQQNNAIAGARIPADGKYYLRLASRQSTAKLLPYRVYLQLRRGVPDAETESNDTLPGQALPAGRWVAGTVSSTADIDHYAIALEAGDTVHLSLDVDPERNGNSNLRLGFGPFDSRMLVVDTPVTIGVPASETFVTTVKDAGTYSIYVGARPGATFGTYHLSVTVLPRIRTGASCRTYTSTNVPVAFAPSAGAALSTLTVPDDVRIADLDVAIRGVHDNWWDPVVELISPAGNRNLLFRSAYIFLDDGMTGVDFVLDDEASTLPDYGVATGMRLQPPPKFRLARFDGERAGGTWTLVLRDQRSSGEFGTITGWGLEICAEPPPPPCEPGYAMETVYATDFELGLAGFTHGGVGDEWTLGLPATPATTTEGAVTAFDTCASGTQCWKTDLYGTYRDSSNQDLVSPTIDLAQYRPPVVVRWAQRYQMDEAKGDHYYAAVRRPGTPALPMRLFEHYDDAMRSAVGYGPDQYRGQVAGWGVYARRADAIAGGEAQVVFHVDSDEFTNLAGVAIDDVSVTACVERDPIYADGFESP